MKYWTFYGERWAAKTSHLSMMREGAYLRLLVWCMVHERPLPCNRRDVLNIARAKGYSQEQATEAVLVEFFELKADGYHQRTADEILAWWHNGGQTSNTIQRSRSQARVTLLRKRRSVYVSALRAAGVSVPRDMGITAVKALAAEHGVTVPESELPVTPKRYETRACNGVTNNPLNLRLRPAGITGATAPPRDGPEGRGSEPRDDSAGPLTLAIRAMEKAGLEGVYPGHPTLMRLLDAGIEPKVFALGAREAVIRGKGYAWTLATIWGRLQDAANAGNGHNGNGSGRPLNGRTSDFLDEAGPLVTPEGLEALKRRLADPNVLDPWDPGALSPSTSELPLKSKA